MAVENNNPKLFEFPTAERGEFWVSQTDLAEERLLFQQHRVAWRALMQKRQYIRGMLDAGAKIEPGLRYASVVTRKTLVFEGVLES